MVQEERTQMVQQGNTDNSAVAECVWNKDQRVNLEAVEVLDMNITEWCKKCVIEF